MNLKYTICFIIDDATNSVLMILRNKPPRKGLGNGLGGKIEPGESPRASIVREVFEEAAISLTDPVFSGIVTWDGVPEAGGSNGMYVYLATLPAGVGRDAMLQKETEEGVLDWLPWRDISSRGTPPVVENLPAFLPQMIEARSITPRSPIEYHCSYVDDVLQSVATKALAPDVIQHAERL